MGILTMSAADWQRWGPVEKLALWEAAALTFGIAPKSIRIEENFEEGGLWYVGPIEFRDLLHQLERSDGLPKEITPSGPLSMAMVRTRDYVEWAQKRGLKLPLQLQPTTVESRIGPRREETLLTIIGAMLEHGRLRQTNQEELQDALLALSPRPPRGISKSTLEDTFAKANKTFDVARKKVQP